MPQRCPQEVPVQGASCSAFVHCIYASHLCFCSARSTWQCTPHAPEDYFFDAGIGPDASDMGASTPSEIFPDAAGSDQQGATQLPPDAAADTAADTDADTDADTGALRPTSEKRFCDDDAGSAADAAEHAEAAANPSAAFSAPVPPSAH